MKILVTGGLGYIGSHTCVELLEAGHEVVVVDNLCNSSIEVISRIEKITGKQIGFVRADVRSSIFLNHIFPHSVPDAVIHFAGLKSIGESVEDPLTYYDNNVLGTIQLLRSMKRHGVKNFIFSSSATVYGDPEFIPINEDARLHVTNAYGRSKLMIEEILNDLKSSDPEWKIACLRYFNPVGAHPSGLIGEDPNGVPNNLMPYIAQVAIGKLPILSVYGNDYDTRDGTGVRDYIHVVDLAKGHLAALNYLMDDKKSCTVNLGTGKGHSVIEMVKAFSTVSNQIIPFESKPRRPGDVATCYADPTLAQELFGWKAERDIDDMCRDLWRWQQMNPRGYQVTLDGDEATSVHRDQLS